MRRSVEDGVDDNLHALPGLLPCRDELSPIEDESVES